VPVTVLNNSRITGLAAQGAARFTAGGWPVAAVGNFRGRIPVTTVYYDPGLETAAHEFAGSFEGVVRVRPRFEGLPARGVVVVLTREFPCERRLRAVPREGRAGVPTAAGASAGSVPVSGGCGRCPARDERVCRLLPERALVCL
jgi:hypothetical protein